MRNAIVATIFLLAALAAQAQTVLRPEALVTQAKQEGKEFSPVSLFQRAVAGRSDIGTAPLENYTLLELDGEAFEQFVFSAPANISLRLPFEGTTLQVELVKIEAAPVPVRESHPTPFGRESFSGLHYRGMVQGEAGSIAAFSFVDGEVMGLISTRDEGNLVLGKLPERASAPRHILYRDAPVIKTQELGCETSDEGPGYLPQQLEEAIEFRDAAKCARIYLEVDFDIFTDKGGTAGAVAYITGLFNQVATLYANENLSMVISEIYVWTSNSPYAGTNPGTLLNQFQTLRTSFNGNLGHLLSYKPSGGIAVLSGFCHPLTLARFGVSGIRNAYANIPTYSWSVMVLAHELGHQFGSKHTHACAWNGNNTALDGCAGVVEGSCAVPPLPAQGTGTIMSYCHVTPVGINLSLGFGVQPGNVMRNAVAAAACLTACTTSGGGGGGNPTPTCASNTVYFRLVLDNYGPETTWRLTNASGQTVKSGGPYAKAIAGTAVLDTFCLPNGCYTFRILDVYGDGICCNFGNGSYTLRNASNQVLASGAQFGFEETKTFCVPTPVQNNCVQVNFNTQPVISYGGAEDQGTFTLLSNNSVLRIQNNAWKAIALNYNVTPNTVIQFEFASTIRGEVHGIGFDNDNVISADRTFKLYGTQNWGILNFNNYPGFSSWITYTIPVGQYYTGSFSRLFFAADHDIAQPSGNSFYRNIRIYEGNACNNLEPEDDTELGALLGDLPAVELYPNPAHAQLQLRFRELLSADEPVMLRIFNATGQLLQNLSFPAASPGEVIPVDISQLQRGAYFLAVQSGDYLEKLKFIKQ